jgi:hypothetical protein
VLHSGALIATEVTTRRVGQKTCCARKPRHNTYRQHREAKDGIRIRFHADSRHCSLLCFNDRRPVFDVSAANRGANRHCLGACTLNSPQCGKSVLGWDQVRGLSLTGGAKFRHDLSGSSLVARFMASSLSMSRFFQSEQMGLALCGPSRIRCLRSVFTFLLMPFRSGSVLGPFR